MTNSNVTSKEVIKPVVTANSKQISKCPVYLFIPPSVLPSRFNKEAKIRLNKKVINHLFSKF